MKIALVTGVTGQDGSFLAELLLTKGYSVIGSSRNVENARKQLPTKLVENIQLVSLDLLDQSSIVDALNSFHPTEVYNFSAYSSGSGMFIDPIGIGDVNGLAVGRILKAINDVDSNIRFCQASSSEMFGKALVSPQSENTPFCPLSPYGAAKLYAHSMIQIYREHYGLFACSAILFNHESSRRRLDFVTRKITHAAANIKMGLAKDLYLGNLEACRDWGFAGDYVRAMWLMLQQKNAEDFVIATGEGHTVRELCEVAFSHLDLDYRDYVREDDNLYRVAEQTELVGNIAKAKKQLGWEPQVSFNDLIRMMVDSDLSHIVKNMGDELD
jgi:GDPmannose 4,6-dehydratase